MEITLELDQRPPEDGLHSYTPVLPGCGAPSFHVMAKTAEGAKRALLEYIYNELDGRDDIEGVD